MTKTFLVTGGAGFIGSQIAERLINDGNKVVILDNLSTGNYNNVPGGSIFVEGDVKNYPDIENAFSFGIDVVVHVAGQASTIFSFDHPEDDLLTNTLGTTNVLKGCLQHKVGRLLYASSMTIYGHPSQLPVNEKEAISPISYYGISKYAAERYIMTTAQRADLDFNFNATAFRMFNVYGERQRLDNPYQGVMGIFIGNVLRKEQIRIFGDGLQSRDFVFISDVVDAWVAAIDNPKSFGQVYNIGFGKAISINDLVDEVLAANNQNRDSYRVEYCPPRVGDQRFMFADTNKAREHLNWTPKITLSEGLQRTLLWAKGSIYDF